MRFERKYLINHLPKAAVEQAVLLHPTGFRKIFPDRQVNNIYFDTPDYQTGKHNIEGVNQRKKFRLRWYGVDLQKITQPRLEIKIKENELGRKEIFPFKNTYLSELEKITKKVQKNLPIYQYQFSSFQPTLLNSYQRSYWGTSDGKFRITVDWDLKFYPPFLKNSFSKIPILQRAIILELKYAERDDSVAKNIFQHLPFRQTKSSKYVTGLVINNFIN